MNKNLRFFMLTLLCAVFSVAWGVEVTKTYIFTAKDWKATCDGSDANWKSGKEGNQFQQERGVQVTTSASGANATSPNSFNRVKKVEVVYSTNASSGAGSIIIQIGTATEKTFAATKTGGTTDRTATFEYETSETGNVKLTVDCTTNSIYIKSIAITYDTTPQIASDVSVTPTTVLVGSKDIFSKTVTTPSDVTPSQYTTQWTSNVDGFVNVSTGEYDATDLSTQLVNLTVTINPNNTENYLPFTKSFNIEVLEDGIFDFNAGLTYGSGMTPSSSNTFINEETTWTASNVVLKPSGKYRYYAASAGNQLRLYIPDESSSTLKIEVPEGKVVTQIEFDAPDFDLSTSDGVLTNKTWKGKSQTVTFNVNKSTNINKITVTYGDDDGKLSPDLQISDVNAYVGSTPELTVSTKSPGSITFVSSNAEIAEVEQDGDNYYVMAYAEGQVQITATQAATDEYSAAEVTFKVTVNPKKNPNLVISNLSLRVDEEKVLNVTTNSPAPVSFTSANDDIAMAEYDTTSESYIVYGFSVGTTVITATQIETDEYQAASKEFTVNVTEVPAVVKYQKITSTADLTSGSKYLIVYENKYYAYDGSLSTLGSASNFKTVTISNNTIEVENDDFYFIIDALSENTYSIKSASGKFIGRTANKNGFEQDETNAYSHTISFNNNNVVITSSGGPKLQYLNSGNDSKFSFYASNQQAIQLYKLVGIDATFKPKFKGYTSIYYSDKNLVVPEKVTGLTYYVEDGRGHYNNDYPAGSILPKNTAVVLEYEDKDNIPEAGVTVTFAETPATGTAPAKNMLRGFDAAQTTTVDADQDPDDYFFYRFTVGAEGSGKENSVGFYWGAADGAPFTAGAHKVYLAVEKSQFPSEQQASSIFVDDSDNISEITSSEKAIEGVYTLSGSRVFGSNLPKGIYIVNGKKVVIK